MRFVNICLCFVALTACAKDPVQIAYNRCVARVKESANQLAAVTPLTDQQKRDAATALENAVKGSCGIIKSACAADRNGVACKTLLQSAGVNP